MTQTDELRRMLDERGVEWKAPASYDGSTKYDTIVDEYWFHEYDGRITVHGLTPAQAIAATVGDTDATPTRQDVAATVGASERTTTRHGKYKTKYGRKVPLCECCGYSIGDMRWHYCPSCGAKVVDE